MTKGLGTTDGWLDEMLTQIAPPRRRRRNKKPELKVQKAIVAYLRSIGVIVAVTDAGILNKMGLGMSCGIPTGWPDITACMPGGRFLGVECKAPTGKQSPAQLAIQAQIENNDGIYILAHSLEEFTEKLSQKSLV